MEQDSSQKIPVVNVASSLAENDSDNKCATCEGSKCCQYTTASIDTPRSIKDFDNLIWHVSHQNTHVFKDDDGWYLLFYASCQHLQPNGFCGIYEKRPFVCRDHSNDGCEKDLAINEGMQLYFMNYDELDDFCRKRFKRWDKRFDS